MLSSTSSLAGSADVKDPEKENLNFNISPDGLSPDVYGLAQHIKQVAESVLYHWRVFPITLPQPIAVQYNAAIHNGSVEESFSNHNPSKAVPLVLRDAFTVPSFDELDSVALDTKGDPRKLSNHNLQSIKEKGLNHGSCGKRRYLDEYQLDMLQRTGEFEVESLHFPGKSHRWRLSGFLQKGSECAHDDFLIDVAKAAEFIVVVAKNRLTSQLFSVKEGFKSFWIGVLKLFDLFFGIPWVQSHNLEQRVKEERCIYLVQELLTKDGDIHAFCSWLKQQIHRSTKEKFHLQNLRQPPMSYLFCTPQGLELDLRLFNRELIRKALPILISILEKEGRGWFLHFREKLIAELKSQGFSDEETEKETNKRVQQEYLTRIYDSILGNAELMQLGEGIPDLLVAQAKAVILMYHALDEVEKIYEEGERSRREELKHVHPILSRVKPWLQQDLESNHQILTEQHKWRPHEHALALCRQNQLYQHSYFLHRDLSFMREREPVLTKELKSLKVPSRTFEWRRHIWFPNNYIVHRSFQGETESIPTVLALSSTTITAPRSDPNQPIYLLEKQKKLCTSTRWPFWRWHNYLHRCWTWTSNILFFFAIWLPLCSPMSLRALFSLHPFMADFELSQVNGTVCPSKPSLTPTVSSRLLHLWRHISKSRTQFETLPDTGFIGKGVSRHIDRLWNYLGKGFLGTVTLVVFVPILSFILCIGSILFAITAPVWVPVGAMLTQIFFIFAYDCDAPEGKNRRFPFFEALLWNILFLGCLQPLASLIFVLLCPVFSFFILIYACGRRSLRSLWDSFMFHAVIKKRGRIPASNSILVKRVAGPGLHNDFVYQISSEQAFAAFECRLELDLLAIYERNQEIAISKPLVEYSEFIRDCFGPFSGVAGRGGHYGRIEKEVKGANRSLHEKLDKRRRQLSIGMPPAVKSNIKMKTKDLKRLLKAATSMLEKFYPQNVFPFVVCEGQPSPKEADSEEAIEELNTLLRQGVLARVVRPNDIQKKATKELFCSEVAWWEYKGLSQGDYSGLAALLFTEIFSADFLTPMEENETCFHMEVHDVNLSRYSKMLEQSPDRPDLEEKLTVHAPRGNIRIAMPFLDLAYFTPVIRHINPTHKEKTSLTARLSLRCSSIRNTANSAQVTEKLLIPPPVPHPAHISAIIFNRDAIDPIELDSFHTKQALRILEDSSHSVVGCETFSQLSEDVSQTSDSEQSSDNNSFYDNTDMYSRPSANNCRDFIGTRRPAGTGRSRTATLEMTASLEKQESSRDATIERSKSSTIDSIAGRASSWISSPLRTLLEGGRPFTVSLNLAAAEDGSVDEDSTETLHTTAV